MKNAVAKMKRSRKRQSQVQENIIVKEEEGSMNEVNVDELKQEKNFGGNYLHEVIKVLPLALTPHGLINSKSLRPGAIFQCEPWLDEGVQCLEVLLDKILPALELVRDKSLSPSEGEQGCIAIENRRRLEYQALMELEQICEVASRSHDTNFNQIFEEEGSITLATQALDCFLPDDSTSGAIYWTHPAPNVNRLEYQYYVEVERDGYDKSPNTPTADGDRNSPKKTVLRKTLTCEITDLTDQGRRLKGIVMAYRIFKANVAISRSLITNGKEQDSYDDKEIQNVCFPGYYN